MHFYFIFKNTHNSLNLNLNNFIYEINEIKNFFQLIKKMKFGYTIVYVKEVEQNIVFFENAFGF